MIAFFRCVAEAVVEQGVRGLAAMVPGGEYACDVAKATWEKYRQRKKETEQRAEIQMVVRATFEDARQVAAEVAREVTAGRPEDRIDLELYLTGIPAAAQQSLRRPDDPTGTTVPSEFALSSPEDLLSLLPARSPRLRPADPLPGRPGWVLDRPLGIGGFGEVWLTRHPRTASLVRAVKFCLGPRAEELRHEARLIDRVMAAGPHPGVVPLVDLDLDADPPWLMYEYVAGGDLADWARTLRRLPPDRRVAQVTAALRQLAGAVGHFHRLDPSVVHRDLKPSNILLDRAARRLRVADFGVGAVGAAVALAADARGAATRSGQLLSCLRGSHTPLYASPEQRRGDPPDPRDDIHALGVIGYQMLTGHLDQGAGPDFADDLREAGAGETLIALLGRCVAHNPSRRPNDAMVLGEELGRVAAGVDPPTVGPGASPAGVTADAQDLPQSPPAPSPATARPEDRPPAAACGEHGSDSHWFVKWKPIPEVVALRARYKDLAWSAPDAATMRRLLEEYWAEEQATCVAAGQDPWGEPAEAAFRRAVRKVNDRTQAINVIEGVQKNLY
ncbi:MAG: hypothetical protein JWO38_4403 [Gemmataceae bacterium]|nr:hypothetical protein [Gemmataceae bacterium]